MVVAPGRTAVADKETRPPVTPRLPMRRTLAPVPVAAKGEAV